MQPLGNLLVGLAHTAQVAAEAILIHALACLRVPQAASVGRKLVSQNQSTISIATELYFEVDNRDARLSVQLDEAAMAADISYICAISS